MPSSDGLFATWRELSSARQRRHFGIHSASKLAAVYLMLLSHGSSAAPQLGRHTLHLTFTTMPVWARGIEEGGQKVRSFEDPGFRLTAGLRGGLEPARMSGSDVELRPGWSSLPHEKEAYPNGDAIRALDADPFRIGGEGLMIEVSHLDEKAADTLPRDLPRTFLSGAFNTYPYCQTYGYFEVVARVPHGRGLWPAIWLLPADGSWPPEIDAPEVLGNNTSIAYYSVHTQDRSWVGAQPDSYAGSVTTDKVRSESDLADDFHRYGVDWQPDHLSFYLDGRLVARRVTPADMHKPFYLIVDLAVGGEGSWPGPPRGAMRLPARLTIKSINAWALR